MMNLIEQIVMMEEEIAEINDKFLDNPQPGVYEEIVKKATAFYEFLSPKVSTMDLREVTVAKMAARNVSMYVETVNEFDSALFKKEVS